MKPRPALPGPITAGDWIRGIAAARARRAGAAARIATEINAAGRYRVTVRPKGPRA